MPIENPNDPTHGKLEALNRRLQEAKAQVRRLAAEAEQLIAEARERRLNRRDGGDEGQPREQRS